MLEEWFTNYLNPIEYRILIRLLLSVILGSVVGFERGTSGNRPAGFRTHILVCTGSALVMIVSLYGFDGYDEIPFEYLKGRDPARIAAQVVCGIGFLGAGTILHEGANIRGLTTAASLWMMSAIGLATGAGLYFTSVAATIITFITLSAFHSIEKHYAANSNKTDNKYFRIETSDAPGIITQITSFLSSKGIKVKTINVSNKMTKNKLVIELYLKTVNESDMGLLVDGLQHIEGVKSIETIG